MQKRRIVVGVGIAFAALLCLGAGAFLFWANDIYPPMPEALAALKSDEHVTFKQMNGWLVYYPVSQGDVFSSAVNTGFILYPGGKVDYRAYAPLAREIAARGYLVVVPSVRLNLALLDPNVAADVIQAFPQIKHWAIGGHSLGGVAAASYAAAHPDQIQGVVFMASYPQDSLANYPGKVLSLFATNDGLASPDEIEKSKTNLAPAAQFIPIRGGNHSQFGYYGMQSGDHPAAISRAEQQKQIVETSAELLARLQ